MHHDTQLQLQAQVAPACDASATPARFLTQGNERARPLTMCQLTSQPQTRCVPRFHWSREVGTTLWTLGTSQRGSTTHQSKPFAQADAPPSGLNLPAGEHWHRYTGVAWGSAPVGRERYRSAFVVCQISGGSSFINMQVRLVGRDLQAPVVVWAPT